MKINKQNKHVVLIFQLMKLMAVRRVQMATSGKSDVPLPPAPPPHPGYAPNAALHAIKRHALEFVSPKAAAVSLLKMTQINFGSRNQLHNTANSCQHLNFGLSWPGQWQILMAKHCQSLKFSLFCTDTTLLQSSIGAEYSKQNMIKFSQCLVELAQKFKFLETSCIVK